LTTHRQAAHAREVHAHQRSDDPLRDARRRSGRVHQAVDEFVRPAMGSGDGALRVRLSANELRANADGWSSKVRRSYERYRSIAHDVYSRRHEGPTKITNLFFKRVLVAFVGFSCLRD